MKARILSGKTPEEEVKNMRQRLITTRARLEKDIAELDDAAEKQDDPFKKELREKLRFHDVILSQFTLDIEYLLMIVSRQRDQPV